METTGKRMGKLDETEKQGMHRRAGVEVIAIKSRVLRLGGSSQLIWIDDETKLHTPHMHKL